MPQILTDSVTDETGGDGEPGADGQHGGAVTIQYTFDTTTADADPGSGKLRLNQATQNTATVIRADLLDRAGGDWTTALGTFDDSTNTLKGHIRIVADDDYTKWLLFSIASLASPSGYKNITVALVSSSDSNPFTNGQHILLCFTRAGDKGIDGTNGTNGTDGDDGADGDDGSDGSDGADGNDGGGLVARYTFDTTTADADPGSGKIRLDNATQNAATMAFVDLVGNNATDYSAAFESLSDQFPGLLGAEPKHAYLRISKAGDSSKWLLFDCNNWDTASGYRKLFLTLIDSSGSNPFANNDIVVVSAATPATDGSDGMPGGGGGGDIGLLDTTNTYYVSTTGDDTTGDGTSGTPWATIAKAMSYLQAYVLTAMQTIQVNDGHYASVAATTLRHANGDFITITGENLITKTLSSIQSSSGSAPSISYILNLNTVTSISVGDYVMIRVPSGGTLPTYLAGCHSVTNVDSGNSRITILNKNTNATAASGAVTGTVEVLRSVLTFASGNGILMARGSRIGSLTKLAIVGAGTSNLGMFVSGASLTCTSVGIYGWSTGAFATQAGNLVFNSGAISYCSSAGVLANLGGVFDTAGTNCAVSAGVTGVAATYNGIAAMDSCIITGGTVGLFCSTAGRLTGNAAKITGNSGIGCQCFFGGALYIPSCTSDRNATGIECDSTGTVYATGSTVTNNTIWGFYCVNYGSMILGSMTTSGNANFCNITFDVRAADGSFIWDDGIPGNPPTVVQVAFAVGGGNSVTFGVAPTNGNLLVAMGFNPTSQTTGSGWTNRAANITGTDFGVINTKVAGAGESTTQSPLSGVSTTGAIVIWEINGANAAPFAFIATQAQNTGFSNAALLAPNCLDCICLSAVACVSSSGDINAVLNADVVDVLNNTNTRRLGAGHSQLPTPLGGILTPLSASTGSTKGGTIVIKR